MEEELCGAFLEAEHVVDIRAAGEDDYLKALVLVVTELAGGVKADELGLLFPLELECESCCGSGEAGGCCGRVDEGDQGEERERGDEGGHFRGANSGKLEWLADDGGRRKAMLCG